tara:strand:+ start:38488 stop:38637 length:150 start_codon:yes stop_codon:yes gene_type:complete
MCISEILSLNDHLIWNGRGVEKDNYVGILRGENPDGKIVSDRILIVVAD